MVWGLGRNGNNETAKLEERGVDGDGDVFITHPAVDVFTHSPLVHNKGYGFSLEKWTCHSLSEK